MDTTAALAVLTQSVQKSVHQFFETMFSIKVEDGQLVHKDDKNGMPAEFTHSELVGVIGLSGDHKGSVSVHHVKGFVEKIGKMMLGTDSIEDAEVNDVAGEICNIIAGGAKNVAATLSLNFNISCPTVVRGKDSHVEPGKKTRVAYQVFKVDGDLLLVTSILAE